MEIILCAKTKDINSKIIYDLSKLSENKLKYWANELGMNAEIYLVPITNTMNKNRKKEPFYLT